MVLEARLTVRYGRRPAVLNDLAIAIGAGEIHGLAGESGSGKSTLALALLRLLTPSQASLSGKILFDGVDLLTLPASEMRGMRGKHISLVLQSPIASLNPRLRIGTQIEEAWHVHEPHKDGRPRILETLADVSLPAEPSFLRLYPQQLSVGMAQRVLIAMAVVHRPKLLIADEATSALDLITQSEILALFRRLSRTHGTALLFITHDLAAAGALCDRISILYRGAIAECGPAAAIFDNPGHEYTRRLVAALPSLTAPSSSRA